MAGPSAITVDLARGEVVLGVRRVALVRWPALPPNPAAGAEASRADLRFRLPDGAIVRAVTFGERSRLIRDALADPRPPEQLVMLLREGALEGPSSTLSDAVLLALSGGAEDAPEFERCAVDVSRLQGWTWLSVHETPAIVVDQALERRSESAPAGEWHRFVFAGTVEREVDELLDEMIARLLARGVSSASPREASEPPNGTMARHRARGMSPHVPPALDAQTGVPERGPASDSVPAPIVASVNGSLAGAPASAAGLVERRGRLAVRAARVPLAANSLAPAPGGSARSASRAHSAGADSLTARVPFPATRPRSRAAGRRAEQAVAAPSGRVLPLASERHVPDRPSPVSSDLGVVPSAASPIQPLPAFRPLLRRVDGTTVPGSLSGASAAPIAALPLAIDLLDELAQALAAECDLRGLDA